MQTTAPSGAPAPLMTHRQILFVIFGLMAGMFLSSLDQTVVGTSMRTIADDLDGLALQAWVTTAYLIVSTISTPIYGKLSDLYGRRPLFIIAITIFLLGSLLSGMATSMYGLALSRAVQGLGAGGLMALPLTIMGDILAPRERAKYQGYFLAVFGVSSVIGPLLGGLFAGASEILGIAGWRWVFLINIPIGLIALIIVLRFLHIPRFKREVRIDWWGAATVIVATVPLLLVAEQGRNWGWTSTAAFTCYIVGALGVLAFMLAERFMGDDALIPLKLFRSPTFSVATILAVLVGFGMFGAMMTLPLYLQLVNGATPTESGLLLLPMILGLMISSIVSGQLIARTGRYKKFPVIGTAFMAAGFLWMTFATADRPVTFMMVGMLLVGLGLGQLMQTLTIASQNAVGAKDIGVATAASTFFRQIGGTLGTAVLFSVLFTRIPITVKAVFSDPATIESLKAAAEDPAIRDNPNNAEILKLLQDPGALGSALDGDTAFLNSASPVLSHPFLEAFNDAAVTVFWVSFVVVFIAFVVSWFLKAPALRKTSALQETVREAAEQAAAEAAEAEDADAPMLEPDEGTGAGVGVGAGGGAAGTGVGAGVSAGAGAARGPGVGRPVGSDQKITKLSGHARKAADQMGALVEPGTHAIDVHVPDGESNAADTRTP
ncbi:MDR family MFS transporter [Leifsonia sp. A12D58]|uniref:MDR family MFS transporter n=1 Tax=Leifsonia sp. A12D58 TaxID=3397674 RepID=UPI0039DFF30C